MTKYTTIAGDMWDGIAYKTLGDEAYTDKIMEQNPAFRHLFIFPAGIVLTIPDADAKVAAGLPPWKKGTA
jgi:phage tail protein X